jgi:hypothetical protein
MSTTIRFKQSSEMVELHDIPRYLLQHKRDEVINAYVKETGMSLQDITTDYEDGIDSWIGFGSVSCFEINADTTVGYIGHDVIMTVSGT